jgi:ribonucleoside-triphosphate reductase
MCCRLRLDLRELRKKSGGFFGSGESTGSVGVVTINLPRIAYLATDEQDFYSKLDELMDISARSLKVKRTFITKLLDVGLYPYTKRYLGTFDNHFSTIGLVGMNEAGLNAKWLRKDLSAPETQKFTKDVLNHMRERLSDYQVLYGDLYNLEATPAESTAYRFAKHDKKLYPDIITANENGTPYYTNSSHLPVGYTDDIFEALDIQDELQTLYTSGTVFHAFLGEKLPDWKSAANLVRKIAENYRLPYYTLSPTYSICKNHGYLAGEIKSCPVCGEDTEIYSRITGYYRPVQNWNDGKAQEFKDRRIYNVNKTHKELILITTSTCTNCKQAEKILKEANIAFKKVLAEDNVELVKRLGIIQAPTLVNNDKKYSGLSEIYKFVNGR